MAGVTVAFDTLKAATRLREEAGFDETKARVLVSTFAEGMVENLATKDDIAGLRREIATLATKEELAALRGEMHEMGAGLRGEMHEMGARLHGEMQRMDAEMHQIEATLRGEMKQMDTNLRAEIKQVDANLRGEMKRMDASLRGEISKVQRGAADGTPGRRDRRRGGDTGWRRQTVVSQSRRRGTQCWRYTA